MLHLLRGEERHARFATGLLEQYADAYLGYPNADNVLGPTRLFFSTYLESIWLLQVCVAVDALEHGDRRVLSAQIAGRVRERVIAPSRELIASYDEGASNRQVWNATALLAAALVLDDNDAAERAIFGPSGIVAHLGHGLLADGSWYEGDNYHLFAHRGLWYGVTMAERLGAAIPEPLRDRFAEGFAIPFATALPDFTFPARRDSQYASSLRQWRYAELAELGLARRDDRRLVDALATMYADDIPRADTGRWRSTADSERNVAASRLERSDLGWRALLHARPALPTLERLAARSILLDGQGLAVFRRHEGRLYVALDYGHSGGGHGHPDRLNLLLSDGATRWLDDPGTGSYVDPSLHWYRSTLAHTAPLANGQSQRRVHGTLRAYDERGGVGWIGASARGIAPGVDASRTVVVMPSYVVDEVTWVGRSDTQIDLPLHVDGELYPTVTWKPDHLHGGTGIEDGYAFLSRAESAAGAAGVVRLHTHDGTDSELDLWCVAPTGTVWWRAICPGPPGRPPARMHLLRMGEARGQVTIVWSPRGAVADVRREGERIVILMRDGSRHDHVASPSGWHVELAANGGHGSIDLGGTRDDDPPFAASAQASVGNPPAVAPRPLRVRRVQHLPPLSDRARPDAIVLGGDNYRRSEATWDEADRPTAFVAAQIDGDLFIIDVHVEKACIIVAGPIRDGALDNEHPDINVDGFQLYLTTHAGSDVGGAWIAVPTDHHRLRVTRIAGWPSTCALTGEWRTTEGGFATRLAVSGASFTGTAFRVDLIVNETTPERARRRGQLVLSGAAGEFVYLRGDRHDEHRLLDVRVLDE
ncbi:MAG: hypothetical protein NVS9B3_05800 [Gemmatimonadaceae bacterium]